MRPAPQIILRAGRGASHDLPLAPWEAFYARPSASAPQLLLATRLAAADLRRRLTAHSGAAGNTLAHTILSRKHRIGLGWRHRQVARQGLALALLRLRLDR